ncbi:hypothetical protein EDF59_15413 [Novosphingobium sp. ST904]|nr:hypothetical protein EDF59_15413 [Novosphingobium sp. ST904]
MTAPTNTFKEHDFFRSDHFVNDPYPYFDYLGGVDKFVSG